VKIFKINVTREDNFLECLVLNKILVATFCTMEVLILFRISYAKGENIYQIASSLSCRSLICGWKD